MAETAEYGHSQIICEVGWRPYGRTFRRRVSRETYLRDLTYAKDLALDVHEWRGEGPDGKPMVVSWIVTPNGRLLAAYEIEDDQS